MERGRCTTNIQDPRGWCPAAPAPAAAGCLPSFLHVCRHNYTDIRERLPPGVLACSMRGCVILLISSGQKIPQFIRTSYVDVPISVIVFEMTGQITHCLPMLISVLFANFIANYYQVRNTQIKLTQPGRSLLPSPEHKFKVHSNPSLTEFV